MKLRFLFLLAATVAFGGPVVAKEQLATAEQRFGGKTEQAERSQDKEKKGLFAKLIASAAGLG